MDSSCPAGFLNFPGYRSLRKDRSDEFKQTHGKSSGGGVAVIFKEDLKLKPVNDLNCPADETLWVSLSMNQRNIILAVLYRPQYLDVSYIHKLDTALQKANTMSKNLVLIGDFNIDLLKNDRESHTLIEHLEGHGLKQHIIGPTRSDLKSESLLDHLWTTDSMETTSGVVSGISDHAGIYAIIPGRIDNSDPVPKTGRSYKLYNPEKTRADFQNILEMSSFEQEIENKNVDRASQTLSDAVLEACDNNAPEKVFKQRNEIQAAPWFTPELESLKVQKEEALILHRCLRTRQSKEKLRKLTNTIKSIKRKLKREHYDAKISQHKDNSKKLWQILKEATRTLADDRNTEPDELNKPTANNFNHFFATIGKTTLEKLDVTEPTFLPTTNHGFSFEPTTSEEVEKLIDSMKENTATGYDKIPAKILKDLKPILSKPLSQLINISFELSIFPCNMKHATVRPIFKNKGSENDPQYYRPISVLTSLSKIVERAAVNRLVNFLESEDKLFRSQHAYRRYHSTTTSLIEINDFIHHELENKRIPAIIATDLTKAFDSVSHGLLLNKLQNLGLHQSCTSWIASYLADRTQTTKFSSVESDKEKVLAGVPQGSILGPILFIAYTTDLATEVDQCKFVSYADDAALLISASSLKQLKNKIESNISAVQNWYTRNGLLINSEKTEFMIFKKGASLEISVNSGVNRVQIQSKECLKVLGVFVDSNLTFLKHISQIRKRASNAIRNISRSRHVLGLSSRILLTNALVVPHYNYGDVVYDGCSAEAKQALERNHNYAARALLGKSKFSSATEALNELNWIPLSQRRRIHQGVLVHKALHHRSSHHVISTFSNLLPQHQHSTRQKDQNKLNSQQHRTRLFEKSTIFKSVQVWNAIPKDIRSTESTKLFKDKLQKFYIDEFKKDRAYVGASN